MSVSARALPVLPGFQLVRRIGRGGMGEVFHAVRVGPGGFRKVVALKQLIEDDQVSGRARQRFLEEALVSAQLDHPNLVRVHDVVVHGSACFIVMELLRGLNLVDAADSLRERGPVPWTFALDVAQQVLEGLAYAHDAKLVHRDLTPRNVFACTSGAVKILDFGIAKRKDGPSLTHSGHVHGTVEMLSPEQARGERVDRRSDIYQLGATLYWLLAGVFPHGSGTPGEVIARAAHGQASPLRDHVSDVPDAVIDLIEKAMARAADDRFPDAAAMRAAVVSALAAAPTRPTIAQLVGGIAIPDTEPAATTHTISATGDHTAAVEPELVAIPPPRRRAWPVAAVLGVGVAALAAGWWIRGARTATTDRAHDAPRWRQLTLDPGFVSAARFVQGGRSYVYSGRWATNRVSVRQATTADAREKVLLDDARVVGANDDEVLVLLQPRDQTGHSVGTLARLSLAGGGPRELMTDVTSADVNADGSELAVVRYARAGDAIEWPLGRSLETGLVKTCAGVRLARDGQRLALCEITLAGKQVVVFDRDGARHEVGGTWAELLSMVWSPDGTELWVSGNHVADKNTSIVALRLDGTERLVESNPAILRVADVTRAGSALVAVDRSLDRVAGDLDGTGQERYLPTLYGRQTLPSTDGKYFLFGDERNRLADGGYAMYKAPVDGSTEPVRFAEGIALYQSRDGKYALITSGGRDRLQLVPLGAGPAIEIPLGDLREVREGILINGDREVIVAATRPGGKLRLYRVDVSGTHPPAELGPSNIVLPDLVQVMDIISRDGARVVVKDLAENRLHILRLVDGVVTPFLGAAATDKVVTWRADDQAIIVREWPVLRVTEIDLATGARRVLREMQALDPTGDAGADLVWMSPDLMRYVTWETQKHSFLYFVEGLR